MIRRLALMASVVAAGYLLGGPGGAAAAFAAALVATRAPRLVAAYGLAALAAAAVATVVEKVPAGPPGSVASFVADREVAASVGMVAGVIVLVAVVYAAAHERERGPVPEGPGLATNPAAPRASGPLVPAAAGLAGAGATALLVGSRLPFTVVLVLALALLVGAAARAAISHNWPRRRS